MRISDWSSYVCSSDLWITILGVAASCALSIYVLWQLVGQGAAPFNENVYTFFQVGSIDAHVSFMVDNLTAMMMVVVTFVSLLVHVYTIGYMADDPGYQRFFSYISQIGRASGWG